MYCTNCGEGLEPADKFCPKCGKPTGVAPEPTPYQRRLARIMSEKKVAGVCAGVASYFGIDVTLVRVVWLIVAICTVVPGFLAYLVAWIAMPKQAVPEQPSGEPLVTPS